MEVSPRNITGYIPIKEFPHQNVKQIELRIVKLFDELTKLTLQYMTEFSGEREKKSFQYLKEVRRVKHEFKNHLQVLNHSNPDPYLSEDVFHCDLTLRKSLKNLYLIKHIWKNMLKIYAIDNHATLLKMIDKVHHSLEHLKENELTREIYEAFVVRDDATKGLLLIRKFPQLNTDYAIDKLIDCVIRQMTQSASCYYKSPESATVVKALERLNWLDCDSGLIDYLMVTHKILNEQKVKLNPLLRDRRNQLENRSLKKVDSYEILYTAFY